MTFYVDNFLKSAHNFDSIKVLVFKDNVDKWWITMWITMWITFLHLPKTLTDQCFKLAPTQSIDLMDLLNIPLRVIHHLSTTYPPLIHILIQFVV